MANNLWNTFLDTTPRQMGHAIRDSIRLLRIPKLQLKSVAGGALGISIFLHSLVFASLFIHRTATSLFAGKEFIEIEMVGGRPTDDVDTVYDDSSDIVIPIPKKKPRPKTLADKWLQKYGNVSVAKDSVKDQKGGDADWRKGAAQADYNQAVDNHLLEKQLEALKQKDKSGFSRDEMIKHLARYQPHFQSCYEKALLADQSLNGKVQFALQAGPSGDIARSEVRFEGVGLPDSQSHLRDCLQHVVREIRFPQTMASAFGRTIQFQAVLSL